MQNQKKTKPVQIDLNYHKALKQFSAIKEKEMREVVQDSLDKDGGFRLVLERVNAQ